MKRWIAAAALGCAVVAAPAQAPATKKELAAKIVQLQQPAIESMARSLAERPAMQLMQAVGPMLPQLPADKRDAAARSIEADVRKFVEEAVPVMRERALKLAPTAIGGVLEEKFTEDELKQLIAWFESPVNKKYQQVAPDMQTAFMQKLAEDAGRTLDPKLQALQGRVRAALGIPADAGSAPAGAAPRRAAPAAKAASR